MAAARPRKKDSAPQQDLEDSILAKILDEHKNRNVDEDFASDVTVLFCGMKRSGKTSIVDRFIKPDKDEKDVPKPTVALDYKFARKPSENSASKSLAHIYDLGGEEGNEELISIPVSASSVGNLVLVLTLDLSEPHTVVAALEKWLPLLVGQVNQCLQALRQTPAGVSRADNMSRERSQLFTEHPDAEKVVVFPVPLLIVGTKWDLFAADADPEKRKTLCRALRYFAHANGASLVFTSLKEKGITNESQRVLTKASMNAVRTILRQLLFGAQSKEKTAPEQVDSSKPLCIMSGKDHFSEIGAPSGGSNDAAWKDLLLKSFPDPQPAQKGGKKSEGEQLTEDLQKYNESSVDGMVEQRNEELQQYRKQVERNQRLASEGVDGSKMGVF